jgi:hypothetical protein
MVYKMVSDSLTMPPAESMYIAIGWRGFSAARTSMRLMQQPATWRVMRPRKGTCLCLSLPVSEPVEGRRIVGMV